MAGQKHGLAKPYTPRTFLSNGAGLGSWRTAGHEITWTLHVPVTDTYALVLKGAVWETDGARRMILLDGNELNHGQPSHFACTDGFGATPEQWRYFLIADPDGKPLPLKLTAGTHALTMVNYANGMNLDTLLLAPVKLLLRTRHENIATP
jgi:hypothetical protein